MTITVERLHELGLITDRMFQAAAEEGIEEVEMSRGGLMSINGVGEKRAQSILDEFEDELAQEEDTETTTKEEGEDKVNKTDDSRLILKDYGMVKEAKVTAFYLGDEAVSVSGEKYIADVHIDMDLGGTRAIQVSLKEGELTYETYGDKLDTNTWKAVKAGLLRAYRNELAAINDEPEEVLFSGESLQRMTEDGFRAIEIMDVFYKSDLTDGDTVAIIDLVRADGSFIKGTARFYEGKLELDYEDELTKEIVDDEVSEHVTADLVNKIRRKFMQAASRAEAKKKVEANDTKPKKEEKDSNINEIKTEGVNPVARNKDGKERVEVVDGMVTQVNGRKLIKEVPAAEYFADKDYGTKKSTVKSTPKNTPESTKKRAPKDHGLKSWEINKTRENLKDINNGTLVAELNLEAVQGKKAQFAAVYYNGSLQFFNKDGKNHLNNETTAQFLTDQVREAYGYTK